MRHRAVGAMRRSILGSPLFEGAGHVTPSIQYVEVPGFDVNETVPGSTAVVTGVRFHYFF
jgi:hypothetical protein